MVRTIQNLLIAALLVVSLSAPAAASGLATGCVERYGISESTDTGNILVDSGRSADRRYLTFGRYEHSM